jgi:ABC-2 type transport system permease protein
MKGPHSILRPAYALWKREIIRFFRQKSRIVGVLLTPFVFWLILGLGFGESFSPAGEYPELSYLEFFFPGIIILVIMFTSIFSNISLIEDRNEGFFQNVLIAPISSFSIVAGKISGSTTIALIQACIFLIVIPFIGLQLNLKIVLVYFIINGIIAIGLSAFGFILAWKLDSIQGFHAIMNILLVPMWLLSGAVFPAGSAPEAFRWMISINPLGYGVHAIRSIFFRVQQPDGPAGILESSLVLTVFSFITLLIAILIVHRTRNGR